MSETFLMDTHALIFWVAKTQISDELIEFLDERANDGAVVVSFISF